MKPATRLLLLPGILSMIALCSAIASSATEDDTAQAAPDMIIVAPQRFHAAVQPLVEHRRSSLSTKVCAIEEILRVNPGVDDPERLKRCLYEGWTKRNLHYVLLVGDADVLPVRYMVLDRITAAAHDIAFYPSDLYYADVAKADGEFEDWNGRRDSFHGGYFGEVRGEKNKDDPINFDQIHYRPELAVGRWPVSTAEEVRRMVTKTIAFEQRVATSQGKEGRAGLLAVGGWVDSRDRMDRVADVLPDSWQIEKRYYADRRRKGTTAPPSQKEVLQLLNSGLDLLCHAGHGTDTGWANCLSLNRIDEIDNAAHLPVVISAGCSTARFACLPPYEPYVDVHGTEHQGTDAGEVFHEPPPPPAVYQRGRYNRLGLGEQLLRAGPNGAVAYIGCNTGSQPCGLTLLEGFAKSWGEANEPRLGDCWNGAVYHYYDRERLADLEPTESWYPPSIFFQGMKFMLFGDPALQLPK